MKTIQFTLDDVLATEQGQAIVLQLLREAAEPVFKKLMNEEHIISNLAWHVVNHCTNMKFSKLQDQVAAAVEEKMKDPQGCIPYFNQNKVLQHYVACAVTENVPLINAQVKKRLENDESYSHVEYQLGHVMTQILAKGLEKCQG